MRRFAVTIIAAALVAACSDRAAAPTSPIRPGDAASFVAGNPPPPPVVGDGSADLTISGTDDSALDCSASASFLFAYEYFLSKTGNNSWVHLSLNGPGLDVAIHETQKKIDARGDLSGAGFTFSITDALSGHIINPDQRVPDHIVVQLTGTLTTDQGSCTGNATFTATLQH